MDGCHILQNAPPVPDVMRYYVGRKAGHCILLMAIADAKRRIVWWDMSKCPQTHDMSAFGSTMLGAHIVGGDLLDPYVLPSPPTV